MDNARLNLLFKNANHMGSSLTDMLDNYKKFTQNKNVAVTILCTDNNQRIDIEGLLSSKENFSVKAFNTSVPISDEDLYQGMLSDAVIVCTRAKTIAPSGLCDILKKISVLKKQVYVIVNGWEAMAKNPAAAKARADRVCQDFSYLKVVDVKNIFTEPIEGYISIEAAVDTIANQIDKKLDILHTEQEETLYQYVKKYVEDYYARSRSVINNSIRTIFNYETRLITKENYYKTKFSNLGVSIQDVVNSINIAIRDISVNDFYDIKNNESLSAIFSRDGKEAYSFAKSFLSKEIQNRITQLKNKGDTKVKTDCEICVNGCVNELLAISKEVANIPFVKPEDSEELTRSCSNYEELSEIIDRYTSFSEDLINNVINRIHASVYGYNFENTFSISARDTGKSITENIKKIAHEYLFDRADDSADNKEISNEDLVQSYAEKNTEEKASMMLDTFLNDIENLLLYSKNKCDDIAHECSKIIKSDIDSYTDSALKNYFIPIRKALTDVRCSLEKSLTEFELE